MLLAFWNNGSPEEVDSQRVRFPNGDVVYNASPDQNRDLYEFLPTVDLPCHPWQTTTKTYELVDGKIKEIQLCVWPPIAELKAKKKAQITAKRREVASGSVAVGNLVVKCTDGNLSELGIFVSQAARGKIIFPVKATTALGVVFLINNPSEAQALLDAIQVHRQTARNVEYDHLVAVGALNDPNAIISYDHKTGWPVTVE